MPDGDIFRTSLCRYQKPYQALCEGASEDEECADLLLKALRGDIRSFGNAPVILAIKIGHLISKALVCGAPNWASLSIRFDALSRELRDGAHYPKELVLRAAKRLRYDSEVTAENASQLMVKRYIQEIYDSGFKGRIPLDEHHAGISDETLQQRISSVDPLVEDVMNRWAKKLESCAQVEKLRMPARKRKEINLNEDLVFA